MYDENEQMQNLQMVARTCNEVGKEIQRLYVSILEQKKMSEKEALTQAMREVINPDPNYVFTGQMTDLSYFANTQTMPFEYINNIKDERLKAAVKDNFNIAARRGLVYIDPESQMIVITEKGKKFTQKNEFKNQALENTNKVLESSDKCVALNGTETDIQIFNYKPQISIGDLVNNGSPELGNKIMGNFNELQAKGLIDIDVNGIMKLTDSGRETLSGLVKSGKINGAALKSTAALGTAGTIVMVVQKAADFAKTIVSTQTK